MTIYNYFINFLEGLLLSSFMAYYFNVKRKKMYILITTIICFFEISISNYYNTFDQLLIFIVIATLFISLLCYKKSKNRIIRINTGILSNMKQKIKEFYH